ncbi:MAG: hypothetical protein ACRED2_01710 [Methylocella sp.]
MAKKSSKGPSFLCAARLFYCGAASLFAVHALLGRFLPRLGPLVATQAASFLAYIPLSLLPRICRLIAVLPAFAVDTHI